MIDAQPHDVLSQAEQYCQERNIRFTESRRAALAAISAATEPLSAYGLLAEMQKTIPNAKPPTAYRAVDFLCEHGFVHRINSMNAYMPCHADHRHHSTQFLVCDNCGATEEIHICDLPQDLETSAKETGFAVRRWAVELHGLCHDCR